MLQNTLVFLYFLFSFIIFVPRFVPRIKIFIIFAVGTNNFTAMGRTAKPVKAKESVKLRFKKLANGNQSIYLDYKENGKRKKEYLKRCIIPERTPIDKLHNQEHLQMAEAKKAQKILELSRKEAGLPVPNLHKMLFLDFMSLFYDEQEKLQKQWVRQCRNAIDRLKEYTDEGLTLEQVNPDFCRGFIYYLCHIYRTEQGRTLTNYTVKNYLSVLSSALNFAVRKTYITANPLNLLDKTEIPQKPESQRVYLTAEELKKLEATECRNPYVKQAYLFSCFCGLRISDIQRLKWADVENTAQGLRLAITQKKTKKPLYLPLNEKATRLLPDRGSSNSTDLVFNRLPNISNIDKILKKWAASAGIDKKITFHTARHTFATLLLTMGADLYTTSKLMGHTEVKTTQIYAKIVDEKKASAVNLLNNL